MDSRIVQSTGRDRGIRIVGGTSFVHPVSAMATRGGEPRRGPKFGENSMPANVYRPDAVLRPPKHCPIIRVATDTQSGRRS